MPEYLAPGVYVEETSFRAKSIEGVGTSTTGFAGLTRKGPVGGTPELITSFGDFERIYGGLGNLSIDDSDLYATKNINYLAHAVRAYFDNGGSRLYVSRVYSPLAGDIDPEDTAALKKAGRAASALVVKGADETEQAYFTARTPGRAGNGRIGLRLIETPATVRSMSSAPKGSVLRFLEGDPKALKPKEMVQPAAAKIEGGIPPFSVADNSQLKLLVNGQEKTATFHARTEAVSDHALDNPMDLPDNDATKNTLRITIDGGSEQTIKLPVAANTTPAKVVEAINKALVGGYARLTTADDAAGAGRLAVGSNRRGRLASVSVKANDALKFDADQAVSGSDPNSTNNVSDPSNVTADEIGAILRDQGAGANASLSPDTGRLVISTATAGDTAKLKVEDTPSAAALGLPVNAESVGAKGLPVKMFLKDATGWKSGGQNPTTLNLGTLQPTEAPGINANFLTMLIVTEDADGNQIMYEDIGFHPDHPRFIGHVLAPEPTRRTEALENMYAVEIGSGVDAFELLNGLFPDGTQRIVTLTGGNDGAEPIPDDYARALREFENVEDIAIVAAPGHSAYGEFQGIQAALITHAERRRSYRIAVLDTPPAQAISEARNVRSRIDSKYAALYYPWVVIANPLARPGLEHIPREIAVPPSGFVCGIYGRNDTQRGVFKAPANEVVLGALRFESDINFAQQEVLNPLGINCLRFFPGRGYRLWGARTASSDPEWKYVNVRRYFNYLERSIDVSTQWAVFEPNGERLWANIRETVSDFLYNEWVSGALLGSSTKEAFFVRCDRSTMTQNDLDNGRLICLIGVAVIKPAEFVIFRIGQKTADSRS